MTYSPSVNRACEAMPLIGLHLVTIAGSAPTTTGDSRKRKHD
jgi:hypothetical protein